MQEERDVVVIDLDGTLCNIEHRKHLLMQAKPDWEGFYSLLLKDTPNKWCVELIQALQKHDLNIWLVSARPEKLAKDTMTWLLNNNVRGVGLALVRPNGDHAPDVTLKRKWAEKFGISRILFAVEDRQRVVQMWRDIGVTCLQCDSWPERMR